MFTACAGSSRELDDEHWIVVAALNLFLDFRIERLRHDDAKIYGETLNGLYIEFLRLFSKLK
jgi:hypothetical protein